MKTGIILGWGVEIWERLAPRSKRGGALSRLVTATNFETRSPLPPISDQTLPGHVDLRDEKKGKEKGGLEIWLSPAKNSLKRATNRWCSDMTQHTGPVAFRNRHDMDIHMEVFVHRWKFLSIAQIVFPQ